MHFVALLLSLQLIPIKTLFIVNRHEVILQRIAELQNEIAAKYNSPDELDNLERDAVDHLRSKLKSFLLAEWKVDESLLGALPLAILSQLSPASPLSLVGCPQGTVPFDLETCTSGIIAEKDIAGICLNENAVYSRHLQSCASQAAATPYTLCPDGFRITLPPVDFLKGPCQSQEVIPAERQCDPPYALLEEEGVCIKTLGSVGYIGCRPGEVRRGQRCYVALQQLLNVTCPDNFEGRISDDGTAECFFLHSFQGGWNPWTQRPVCPPNTNSVVERYPAPKSQSEPSFVTNQANVTCIETRLARPLSVMCPPGTVHYNEYIALHQNSPPIEFDGSLGDPQGTCILLKEFPIGPACPKIDQRVFLMGEQFILSQAAAAAQKRDDLKKNELIRGIEKQLVVKEDYKQSYKSIFNVQHKPRGRRLRKQQRLRRERDVNEMTNEGLDVMSLLAQQPALVTHQYAISKVGPSNKNRLNDVNNTVVIEMETNQLQNKDTQLFSENGKPVTVISTSIGNAITVETTSAAIDSLRLQGMRATAETTITTSNSETMAADRSKETLLPPGTPLLDIDWKYLVMADALIAQLKGIFNISGNEIEWVTPFRDGNIQVICESTETAQFYLSCPEKFRLRKDGSCRGYGYTNFLVLCPEDFALDQVELSTSRYRFPSARCVGQVPTATEFFCPPFDEQPILIGNKTFEERNIQNIPALPEQYWKDKKVFPFLEYHYFEELLMLQFLTDAVTTTTERGGTSKASTQGTSVGAVQLADLLDQFDRFHAQREQMGSLDMLKDYPNLDRLILVSMAQKIVQNGNIPYYLAGDADTNGSTQEGKSSGSSLMGFSPSSSSSSLKSLDRDYLRWILSHMPLIDGMRLPLNQSPQIKHNNYSTITTDVSNEHTIEIVKDEYMKQCYGVKRMSVWFSPSEDIVLGLYGQTFGGEFLSRVDRAKRTGGSPFYPLLPKLFGERPQNDKGYSMSSEERLSYTRLQQAPRFGPRTFQRFRQPEISLL